MSLPVEELWALLLSREPQQVLQGWRTLSQEEQVAVWVHLRRMVNEPDWTEPQRVSAQAAIEALRAAGVDW